jgi:HEAT repeat protein
VSGTGLGFKIPPLQKHEPLGAIKFMTMDTDRNIPEDLSQRIVSENRLIKVLSHDKEELERQAITLLRESLSTQNPQDVEDGLLPVFVYKMESETLSEILCALLLEEWHYKHEDIVSKMQADKKPIYVEPLYQTAVKTFKYLDYDDTYGLARKCTWALYEINTKESIEKLKKLSLSDNKFVKQYALKRLTGGI